MLCLRLKAAITVGRGHSVNEAGESCFGREACPSRFLRLAVGSAGLDRASSAASTYCQPREGRLGCEASAA